MHAIRNDQSFVVNRNQFRSKPKPQIPIIVTIIILYALKQGAPKTPNP